MARFIEADVIQKIATEAEWLTQTRIPYKGQIMLVSDSTGKVTNIKVGDGVNPFADLNYMFDSIQQNASFVPTTGSTLPTPSVNPAFTILGDGAYGSIPADEGNMRIATWDGSVWSVAGTVAMPIQEGTDTLESEEIPKGKAVIDYAPSKVQVGIESYNIGDNIAPFLSNSNFSDALTWTLGYYLPDGIISPSTNNYYSKKVEIVAGTYTCNLLLGSSNNMSVVLFDTDGNFLKSYNNKTSGTDWTIEADEDGYIAFSKLASQAGVNNYCKTQQAYGNNVTSNVFLKTDEAVPLIDYKIENYAPSKADIGIRYYNAGDNIAPFLDNSDFGDTSIWTLGHYMSDGTINTSSTNTFYSIPVKIVAGEYKCNIILPASNDMSVVLFDNDMNFLKSYKNKPSTEWPVYADEDGYIAFSKLSSQASVNNYCKTEQSYQGDVSSDVFIKTEDAVPLIERVIEDNTVPQYFKAINKSGFNSKAIRSIELLGGTEKDLKDENGKWLRLFLVYQRFLGFDSVASTIVQVAKWNSDSGTVGNNNIAVSSYGGTQTIDDNGQIVLVTTPTSSATSRLSFKISIDTNYLRKGVDTNVNLNNGIELDTQYIFSTSLIKPSGENGASLGDSTTGFNNHPDTIGINLNIPFLNCGVGGSTMAVHPDSDYNQLAFYKLADAINSANFSSVNTAFDNIIATASPLNVTRLTRTKNNLNSIDFSKLTKMNVWYGTNDFARNTPIGSISLSNKDTSTVVGALNYGIEKIQSVYPNIQLFIITPYHRFMSTTYNDANDSDYFTNSLGLKLIDYVDAIIQMAHLNHLPVLDLYRESGYNKYNHTRFYEDGVHLNTTGAVQTGNLISAFIKSKIHV